MTDIAGLGIKVTTDGVQKAAVDLDKLAASGDKAATSNDKLNKSFSQGTSAPIKKATEATAAQTAALAKLAGQIDPTVAKLEKLDAQQAKLSELKKSGLLSSADFAALNAALDVNRLKVTGAGEAVHKFSLNNSMARREVGRLGSDLVNGNWGRFEQTSMTLANYSGLMAMAFSKAGVAVLGVVGVLGAFAVAAYKQISTADSLNKSLIATGNYAGTTAKQLESMADRINGASYGTAIEAINKLAASGRVASDTMQTAAQAAVDMASLTGESVDSAAKAIERLATDPATAVASLNEQFHFLTATQSEAIITLEEEGNKADAAKIAIDALGAVMHQRAVQAKADGPWFTKAFDGWAKGASNIGQGLGQILTLGGPSTDIDKYTAAVQRYREAVKQLETDRANGRTGIAHDINVSSAQSAYNKVMDIWNSPDFQKERDQKQVNAVVQSVQDDGVAATATLAKLGITLDGMKDKQEKVNEAAAALYKAHLAGVNFPGINFNGATADTPQGAGWDAIVAKLDPKKKPKAPGADPFASLNGLVQKAQVFDQGVGNDKADNAQVTAILAIVDAGAKLIASGHDVAKVQADVATGVSALNEGYAKQADILKRQNVVALKTYQEAIDQQIADKQKQIDLQVAAIGMSAKEVQQQTELNAIYSQVDKTIEQLNRSRSQRGANVDYIDGEIAAQKASIPILVAQENAKFKAIDAAQANWLTGAIKAMKDYADAGQNVAGMTATFFTDSFSSMGDALANFATTGKLDFKGLVSSILSDLAKMEVRIAASKILQMFIGGMSTTSGYNSATPSQQVAYDVAQNAKGGVYTSPSLSAYSGQIVSQPTAFAFAKGAGIMGEAGPEAILPLSRGADGKLGVKAGGSGGDVNISQTFVIDSNGSASGQTSGTNDDSIRQFAGKMKGIAQQAILDEQRPGGSLWRMRQSA